MKFRLFISIVCGSLGVWNISLFATHYGGPWFFFLNLFAGIFILCIPIVSHLINKRIEERVGKEMQCKGCGSTTFVLAGFDVCVRCKQGLSKPTPDYAYILGLDHGCGAPSDSNFVPGLLPQPIQRDTELLAIYRMGYEDGLAEKE